MYAEHSGEKLWQVALRVNLTHIYFLIILIAGADREETVCREKVMFVCLSFLPIYDSFRIYYYDSGRDTIGALQSVLISLPDIWLFIQATVFSFASKSFEHFEWDAAG